MALRFGSQQHPSGGLRFGSQEYAAVNAVAGTLAAVEAGADVLAADSYPRVTGSLVVNEAGSDTFAATGLSSLLFTMQARESPTPDSFVASGRVIQASLRFGSQEHPSGGLRFGAQSWAPLGPSGSFAATETGSDGFASTGFRLNASYGFAAFDILASFVNYSSESIGSGIDGTLDSGNKVLLPVSTPGGIAFNWETNDFGNPSLRLENLVGAQIINSVPWYVWDGSAWTAATFDVSDAMQGAVFMTETGADIFQANAAQTRYGSGAFSEVGDDFLLMTGAVAVRGAISASEAGIDVLAASGAPRYIGIMAASEAGDDELAVSGCVAVTASISLVEGATPDAFTAAGRLSSAGAIAAIEQATPDAFTAAGRLSSAGAIAAIEQATPDVAAAMGAVRVAGALISIDAGTDAFSAAGRLDRSAVAALEEAGSDSLGVSGAVRVSGALGTTDRRDTFACFGVRASTGDVAAAELTALEGGADRFVSRGRNGNVVAIPTFDGPVNTVSGTRVVVVRSRRTMEAA